MQAAEHVETVSDRDQQFHAGRARRRMKVVNERCDRLTLGENTAIGIGEAEITVWDHEVSRVQDLVEDDLDSLKVAKRQFENKVLTEVADRLQRSRVSVGGVDDVRKRLAAKDQAVVTAHEEVLKRTGESVEACFYGLTGRSLKPLTSAEVVSKEPILNKWQAQKLQEQQMFASMIAKATAEANKK